MFAEYVEKSLFSNIFCFLQLVKLAFFLNKTEKYLFYSRSEQYIANYTIERRIKKSKQLILLLLLS